MASGTANATIEGFVTDSAFTDLTKNISDVFPSTTANVAELSATALTYFSSPVVIADRRASSQRSVNWAAQSSPKIFFDGVAYPTFISTVKNLNAAKLASFFKIVDKLVFDYEASASHTDVEALLTTDVDTKDVYVADSFAVSSLIVTDTVYTDGNTPKQVPVPSYASFKITLPSGSTSIEFTLKIYAGIDAWLKGYSRSTVEKVVPPLPYEKLYNASLGTATDNIFSTASLTASLSYNTMHAKLGSETVSGMVGYTAVLKDSSNNVAVPFNILFKGRPPTLYEIRNAIRQELLNSGVGDEAGWKRRIPGVFVTGRFYVVPLWSEKFQRPDQLLYPNILEYNKVAELTNTVLSTLGYADIKEYMDVMSVYYNRMTATVIPDLSGSVDIARLGTVIPDYQAFSPSDEQFAYMAADTQLFARELNKVLVIDSKAEVSSVYGPNTEGVLSFYSYTVGTYEICVITKLCYETTLESEL